MEGIRQGTLYNAEDIDLHWLITVTSKGSKDPEFIAKFFELIIENHSKSNGKDENLTEGQPVGGICTKGDYTRFGDEVRRHIKMTDELYGGSVSFCIKTHRDVLMKGDVTRNFEGVQYALANLRIKDDADLEEMKKLKEVHAISFYMVNKYASEVYG